MIFPQKIRRNIGALALYNFYKVFEVFDGGGGYGLLDDRVRGSANLEDGGSKNPKFAWTYFMDHP